jgi:CheY-like chemotaxis protein
MGKADKNCGTNVLIVDDCSVTRGLLVKMFHGQGGFAIITASDGKEALRSARDKNPELILMDNIMPRMGGIEACAHIRALNYTPAPIIIIMSSLIDSRIIAQALVRGADDFIQKPIDKDLLFTNIYGKLRIYNALKKDNRADE